MQIDFTFRNMTVTLVEPLARHDIQKQTLDSKLIHEWAARNDLPAKQVDDMAWFEIIEFGKLFIGVEHVESPAGYMPPLPLPFNNAAVCFDAMEAFWNDAPLAFANALREAREDLEAALDPNV